MAGLNYLKLMKNSLKSSFLELLKSLSSSAEILSYDPSSLNYSIVQAVQQGWITPNSWKLLIQGLFILLLGSSSCSSGLNYPMLIKYSPMIFVPSITRYFKQFNRVELHWTHEVFFYDPCSLHFSVVQAVRMGLTTSNSWNVVLWSFFPQLLDGSSSSTAILVPLKEKDHRTYFMSSRLFHPGALLKLLSNWGNMDHRRTFHEFGV